MRHHDHSPSLGILFSILLIPALACADPGAAPGPDAPTGMAGGSVDASVLEVLEWRPIGPWRGGKSIAGAGHPTEPGVFYMGSTNGGGVWKTDDAGVSWHNLSDGYFGTTTVSSLDISQSDPEIVYVGTGDVSFRTNISRGDGIYRSDDAGRTWRNMGLADTRNLSAIEVHPRDPDLVYAASHGHGFIPDENRGVYRSRDGGETWERVLYIDDETGVIDLVMDRSAPGTLYAATWNGRRFPWDDPGRGSPQRNLEVDGRRGFLGGDHSGARTPGRTQGPHCAGHLPVAPEPGVGADDGGRGRHGRTLHGRRARPSGLAAMPRLLLLRQRALPLGGRRRHLGAGGRQPQLLPAPVVLHARRGRPHGPGRRVRAQHLDLEVDGRGRELHRPHHAPARRPPCAVDRPHGRAPHAWAAATAARP